MKHLTLSLVALAAGVLAVSSMASANPAAQLSKLERQFDRLEQQFQANCDANALTQQCSRHLRAMNQISERIETASASTQRAISSTAFESTVRKSAKNSVQREYNDHVAQLTEILAQIERLQASNAPNKAANLFALEKKASVLRMRLLRLQSRIKGSK